MIELIKGQAIKMFTYNFEKLEVWKLSLKINDESLKLLKKLPSSEKCVLRDQLRRALLSICLNIAEGSGRGSKKDFGRFVRNSIGSTLEVIACFRMAVRQKYLDENECETINALLKETYFKLIKLSKYLQK